MNSIELTCRYHYAKERGTIIILQERETKSAHITMPNITPKGFPIVLHRNAVNGSLEEQVRLNHIIFIQPYEQCLITKILYSRKAIRQRVCLPGSLLSLKQRILGLRRNWNLHMETGVWKKIRSRPTVMMCPSPPHPHVKYFPFKLSDTSFKVLF